MVVSVGSVKVLNGCLEKLTEQMRTNTLKLTPDTTEVLLLNKEPVQGPLSHPLLEGAAFTLHEHIHHLGVLLDPGLQSCFHGMQ